ncbi:MAG: trypsin-like serine protease [Deltaproteobacteria bacterium]|nr:trypsin-like serine protease [Deltaproteobacteria bacterium]
MSFAGTLIAALLLAVPAGGTESLPPATPRIVNGVLSADHPSVGALLRGSTPNDAGTWCSGTLIGCSTFLTAGHCVEGRSPSELFVYLPHAGIFPVASIAQHPGYDFPAADVAVVKLATPVEGVAPTAIETSSAPPFGTPGTIVGYGRAGDPLYDYGLKRAGSVVTASCTTIPAPGSNSTSVCWDFTEPKGAPGTDSNTCNADSGGPLFVDLGGGARVAGITSGGSSSSCQPMDHSYDANVFTYRAFIQTEGGADLANTRCGGGPQIGEPGALALAFDGSVSGAVPDATHAFTVGNGTTTLSVAMNAVDDGVGDFDLYVKAGSPPTTSDFDCARAGPNQYGVCTIASPVPGPWYVLVHRYAGAGTYQVTATQLGTSCSLPGSDGTPCDDGNPCTSADVCLAGACGGTAAGDGAPCSDGNDCTGPDTCQSGACGAAPLANGTPCDDGDPCSRPDACQAGVCTGVSPATTCKVVPAGAALLSLDNRSPDSRDRFAWTWRKGSATSHGDLGNPLTATSYALCLYDTVGGVPQRRLSKVIPAGPLWKAYSRGFRFHNATLSTGGIQSVALTEGLAGRSSVHVRGKGAPLALPTLPLAKQPSVTVQLLNDTACWTSTHTIATTNNLAKFRAKSQ